MLEKKILDIVKKDSDDVAHWKSFSNYYYRGEETDILVRDNREYNDTLIIAMVQFKNKRKGLFKELEKLLFEHANTIIIESILTEEMKAVAEHLGYKKASENEYEMNWIKNKKGIKRA